MTIHRASLAPAVLLLCASSVEGGQILRDRVRKEQRALLLKHHDPDAHHRLRMGGDPEDVLHLHQIPGLAVTMTQRLGISNAPVAEHHRHHARKPPLLDVVLEHFSETIETLC